MCTFLMPAQTAPALISLLDLQLFKADTKRRAAEQGLAVHKMLCHQQPPVRTEMGRHSHCQLSGHSCSRFSSPLLKSPRVSKSPRPVTAAPRGSKTCRSETRVKSLWFSSRQRFIAQVLTHRNHDRGEFGRSFTSHFPARTLQHL